MYVRLKTNVRKYAAAALKLPKQRIFKKVVTQNEERFGGVSMGKTKTLYHTV